MKTFIKKLNIFLYRWDGVISLLTAGVTFLALIQCALGVQNGMNILSIPCVVLCITTSVMLGRFLDWLLLVDRRTRNKLVRSKIDFLLETWDLKGEEDETIS